MPAAPAATRKKDSYLQSQFQRVKGRRGPKQEIIAVAASMLADRDKERVKQRRQSGTTRG